MIMRQLAPAPTGAPKRARRAVADGARESRVARSVHERRSLGNLASIERFSPVPRVMRTPAEPYVKKINVDLNTPQNVSLEWQGTPPAGVSSSFRCSTGKGYGDPDDPPGVCNRACCTPGSNLCEAPFDQRESRGSCCTPVGDFEIQAKDRDHRVVGGTIPFWMYFYRRRGIALHEYSPVDGTPISHGCVRLDSLNAERLFSYSYVGDTKVSVSGTATPACPAGRACSSRSSQGALEPAGADIRLAGGEQEEVDTASA